MAEEKPKDAKGNLLGGKTALSSGEIPPEIKKELAKVKGKIESLSKSILKKFSYVAAIGLLPAAPPKKLPPQIAKAEAQKEQEKPKPELIIIFPDDKLKEIKKLEKEVGEMIKKQGLQIKFFTRAMKELWQIAFDGRFLDIERIGMAYPLHDNGILSALRVATIHKNLVLRKFEKYVTSYVIAGSLVRGNATKTSDVDIYIVIDDTDVKRMSRFDLKERLRAMIYSYAFEANEIAGAKNKLSPQIYLLTEFWESVKDANPVIFTFIRDGVPLYDRGAFMPWKLLLKMGKIKPSPEAIDNFLMLGERLGKKVKIDLNRIATEDIYWGIITPSQAALMLYGLPPPTPVETIDLMKKTFVDKEKLLERKYIKILEKIVGIYKGFEHGKVKEVTGKEIDNLVADASAYIKRLKELVKQIEKQVGEKVVLQIYDSTLAVLEKILGKGSEKNLVEKFKTEIINKGEMTPRNLEILQEIIKAKHDYKKGKLTKREVDRVRMDAHTLTESLTEYGQRKNLFMTERSRFRVKIGGKPAELFIFGDYAYLVSGEKKKEVWNIDLKKEKLVEGTLEELAGKLKNIPKEIEVTTKMFITLKKILGKEITFMF